MKAKSARPSRRQAQSMLLAMLLLTALVIVGIGCDANPKSARGFRLPDGNVDKGKQAFVALNCHVCHTVDGVTLPAPTVVGKPPVPLGGEVTRIKTYGELVTSIINPSHQLSPRMKEEWEHAAKMSPMPDYNNALTVAQMIDLVAFLQPRYTKLEVDYLAYP